MVTSHLAKPIGLSSKIVPTLTENCLRHPRQVQSIRDWINDTRVHVHRGQTGAPFIHFSLATASKQTSGSEKYWIASIKPLNLLSKTASKQTSGSEKYWIAS